MGTNKGAGRTSVRISAILAAKEQLDTFVTAVKNTDPNKFLSPQGEIAVSAKGLSVAVAFIDIDINDPKAKEKAKALLCIVDVRIVNLRVVTTSFFFRQTTKTEATATQKADETTVKNALQSKNIVAQVRVAKVVSNDTFKEAVDQSVKKEVKQLKASQTKTASAMPESTEIPTTKISEHPQSSKHMSSIKPSKTYCSKHSKTACTKHKSSDMKHSTDKHSTKKHSMDKHSTMKHSTDKHSTKKHSMDKHSTRKHSIKPSKTRTMMPITHTVTKRPVVESNEIICGKDIGVMVVPPGQSRNFTSFGFPKLYPDFADCNLRIHARKGTKNSITCEEMVIGHGSKLCIYNGNNTVVKKYRCRDRNECRICPEKIEVGDKVRIHAESCMFRGKIRCRFDSAPPS